MAVNLSLTPEAASALQAEVERTGRSQQVAYRRVVPRLRLPNGTTSLDLLDRAGHDEQTPRTGRGP